MRRDKTAGWCPRPEVYFLKNQLLINKIRKLLVMISANFRKCLRWTTGERKHYNNRHEATAIGVLSAITLYGCLGYAIYTRTYDDWAGYPFWIGTIASLLVALLLFLKWNFSTTVPKFDKRRRVLLGAVQGWVMIFTAFFYSLVVTVYDLISFLQRSGYIGPAKVVGIGIITFLIGLSFFYFRLKHRFVYGLTEALVGVVGAAIHVSANQDAAGAWEPSILLGVLTAGVYLVVRGLDNVHTAYTKETGDPVASKLRAMMSEPASPHKAPPPENALHNL